MKKIAIVLCMLACTFGAVSSFAQDAKVVVIPLSAKAPAAALPIAYGYVFSGGNLQKGYGVTSCSSPATGVVTCILETSFQSYPSVAATSISATPNDEIVTSGTYLAGNTVTLNITNGAGTAVNSALNFIIFGTPQ